MIDFRDSQFEREIILWGVQWYVAYPISYRQLEEMVGDRSGGGSGSLYAQSLGHQIRAREHYTEGAARKLSVQT
jgi:putative transposase